MSDIEFASPSEDHTHRLGLAIASCLEPGTLIGLTGTLGAGKTRLVQAIAVGLGIEQKWVVSPTFTLIQSYDGRLPLVHIDVYRVSDEDEFLELGIEEYFETKSAVIIEWADRFVSLLPSDRLWIDIQVREHDRLFCMRSAATGPLAKIVKCVARKLGVDEQA